MIGALCLVNGCGGSPDPKPISCTLVDCTGNDVKLLLVDEAGDAVLARGELRGTHRQTQAFDCTVAPDPNHTGLDCDHSSLLIGPVHNDDDSFDIRFEFEDESFTDWIPVALTIEKNPIADFNGPGCDCTQLNGSAMPVTVPPAAQLPE